jgi:hypothetical protein
MQVLLANIHVPVFLKNDNLSVNCSCRAVFDVAVMVPTPPDAITLAGMAAFGLVSSRTPIVRMPNLRLIQFSQMHDRKMQVKSDVWERLTVAYA